MKFTIVFPAHESSDLSIAAVFIPCLVWMEGERELLNPHPANPLYQSGDLQTLFERRGIRSRISDHTKRVTVVAHPVGHGTEACLAGLVKDLQTEGFMVTVVQQ